MSSKVEEITTTTKKTVYFCDLCEKRLYQNLYTCRFCGRDFCRKCTVDDLRDSSDYPDHYCKSCWDSGKELREKMQEIEDAFYERMEELENEWKNKALLNIVKDKESGKRCEN